MLALLLVIGRWAHSEAFKHRRFSALGAGIPPSLLGGLVGLLVLIGLKEVASMDRLVDKARDQLHEMVTDLIPHAFAALTLGFAAGSSLGGHRPLGSSADLFASWHQVVGRRSEASGDPRRLAWALFSAPLTCIARVCLDVCGR
jgi:hypothetical protein